MSLPETIRVRRCKGNLAAFAAVAGECWVIQTALSLGSLVETVRKMYPHATLVLEPDEAEP